MNCLKREEELELWLITPYQPGTVPAEFKIYSSWEQG